MATIWLETQIDASIERCFDLARNIDIHRQSAVQTKERAIAGVTTGLIGPGDIVTWEAVHFGIRQRLTVRITEFARPHYFVDEIVQGIFKELKHIHRFTSFNGGTQMVDIFHYRSPLGVIGKIADSLFLEGYMRSFLYQRNLHLKKIAESGG